MSKYFTVDDIIFKYHDKLKHIQPRTEIEFEVRFILNSLQQWKDIYAKLSAAATGKVQQSITTLIDTVKNISHNRKESIYSKGVRTAEKYVKKTQLGGANIRGNAFEYKVSVSSEEIINKFNIINPKEIRLRIRSSLIIDELPDWQIDFTFVKTLTDAAQFQNIAEVINSTLSKKDLTISNYIAHIETIFSTSQLNYQYTPELELEYIGKNLTKLELDDCIKYILSIICPEFQDQSSYHEKLYQVAKIILADQRDTAKLYKSKFSLKQLANQPISFDLNDYKTSILPRITEYYLSDKADGERCFMVIETDKTYILSSSAVVDITDHTRTDAAKFVGVSIFDVEVLGLTASNFDKIYIFDVLCYNDEKQTQNTMENRDKLLDLICEYFPKTIQKKILVHLTSDYAQQIKDMVTREKLYVTDGLIFTPNFSDNERAKYVKPENYFDMIVYKWKPPEQMTIDFMVMKVPKNLLGIKPYTVKPDHELYLLFCGIKLSLFTSLNMDYIPEYRHIFEKYKLNQNYFPIQFSPSSNPHAYLYQHPLSSEIKEADIHGHVIEFKFIKQTWIIERLRKDRDINIELGTGYGNDFVTAEWTYNSYQNPLTLDILTNAATGGDVIQGPYFATQKSQQYKALTKFNAFVKAQLIRQLENCDWVIDLASGKGQDLFVYNGFKIKNCLFVEVDKDALAELNNRKYSLDKPEFYVYNQRPKTNMSIYTKNLDLTEPYESLLVSLAQDVPIPPNGVDGVVNNLAIHYITTTQELLDNFVNLIYNLVKPGGIFIFTCFDGNKIMNLLSDTKEGESWDLTENDQIKYSIKKLYADMPDATNSTKFGKKIAVIHPFSDGKYYDENILDLKNVIKAFEQKGFHIRQNGSFGDWLNKFKSFNFKLYNNLTKHDILYSSFYNYISMWKPV